MITHQHIRLVARRTGVSRLRGRVVRSVRNLPLWREVPARRLKDLTPVAVPRRRFALTFDDGPDPEFTPRLLDALDEHSCRATFFMCGFAARNHPELVKEVAGRGHAIGGHSWDHRPCVDLREPEWRRQLDDTHHLLEDLSGAPVRMFRPPFGELNEGTLEAARDRGLATVLWSTDGQDWELTDPEEIAELALRRLADGGIVLLHDSSAERFRDDGKVFDRGPTVAATEVILRTMRERGLEPTELGSLPMNPASVSSGLRLPWSRDGLKE